MPTSSGPYTPVAGQSFTVKNPISGVGARAPSALVLINLSPFELIISTATQNGVADFIDPYSRDQVAVDLSIDTAVSVEAVSVGIALPGPVTPQVFALWYLPDEPAPSPALPSPISLPNQAQNSLVNAGNWMPLPVDGQLTIDLTEDPGVFRSALVILNSGAAAGQVSVEVLGEGGATVLELHDVKMLSFDYATFRLPLTPSSSNGTMGVQIALQPGAMNGAQAIVTLDTTPAEALPYQLFSNEFYSGTVSGTNAPLPGAPIPTGPMFTTPFVAVAGNSAVTPVIAPPGINSSIYVWGVNGFTQGSGQAVACYNANTNNPANRFLVVPQTDQMTFTGFVNLGGQRIGTNVGIWANDAYSTATGGLTIAYSYGP